MEDKPQEHYREVVQIADLADERGMVRGRTFIDCFVLGPAVLAPLRHAHFVGSRFDIPEGQIDAMLWEVPESTIKVGIIGLTNVSFTGCEFRHIGIAGTPKTIAQWRQVMRGAP